MILVTGSNSYLGKKLVKQLLNEGHKVRCIDIERSKDHPENIEFIQTDLLDKFILKKACEKVTTIFHFLDVKKHQKKKRKYMKKVNITGTKNLLEVARISEVKKFFFNSTFEIYGKSKAIPTRQDDRKKPITKYGKDKLKAENICWDFVANSELAICIFRPSIVCGADIDDPIILINLYLSLGLGSGANRLYLSGNGDTRVQLVHPDDLMNAYMTAFNNGISAGKVYNLGSDNVPTQIEQIVTIKKEATLDCEIKHLSRNYTRFLSIILKPFKINYLTKEHLLILLNNIMLDCQRAKTDLNWNPKRNNIDILLETIDWYRSEKL